METEEISMGSQYLKMGTTTFNTLTFIPLTMGRTPLLHPPPHSRGAPVFHPLNGQGNLS